MKLRRAFVILLTAVLLPALGYMLYTYISGTVAEDVPPTKLTNITTQPEPFSFTAAGDFSSSAAANKVLSGIASSGSQFTLGLGDLGYGGNGSEKAWCDFVKQRIGDNHPFQIVAGNHDDGTKDGNITEYAKCLPDKMENTTGAYGTEYYFDYNNLARFIMISPDIDNYGFEYTNGGQHLKWLTDAVSDARSKGIEWIVVGMHKNCITPGVKTCEIGDDLLNTMINIKVDLVLQGHEHAYFRSKQLALNSTTCPAIIINQVNNSCISSDRNNLKKGSGTVIVISGAGGYDLREVNLKDPEIGYFNALNGLNVGNSFGFSKFGVSAVQIDASFIPVTGSFTDQFTISSTAN